MLEHVPHLIRVDSVKDVEEVRSVNLPSFREGSWQTKAHLTILRIPFEQVADLELRVVRHGDRDYFFPLEQLLLFRKDIAKEVLIDVINRWHVVLHYNHTD